MLVRIGVIAFLLIAGIPMGLSAWTESKDRFQIHIKVFKDAEKPSVSVDSAIVVTKDGRIQYFSGGEAPAEPPAKGRRFGTQIDGTLSDDGKQLALTIKCSSPVHSADGEPKVIVGESIDLQTAVVPGMKTRLHCGGDRWCEITVEGIAPDNPRPNESK
jgi:hypothetical protein